MDIFGLTVVYAVLSFKGLSRPCDYTTINGRMVAECRFDAGDYITVYQNRGALRHHKVERPVSARAEVIEDGFLIHRPAWITSDCVVYLRDIDHVVEDDCKSDQGYLRIKVFPGFFNYPKQVIAGLSIVFDKFPVTKGE